MELLVTIDGAQPLLEQLIAAIEANTDAVQTLVAANVHRITLDEVRQRRIEAMFVQESEPEPVRQGDRIYAQASEPEFVVQPVEVTAPLPEGRQRETPLKRQPRTRTREQIYRWLADGEWHTPMAFALHMKASGRKERAYYRGQADGVLREDYRDGKIERRESEEPGARWQYRLPKVG